MHPEYINVVGILKNVQHINVQQAKKMQSNFLKDKNEEQISLNNMVNKYIGEIHSTHDDNHMPIILTEDGFSPLTSLLLSTSNHYIIVI